MKTLENPQFYAASFKEGEFLRPESRFRNWIRADGSTPYLPEPGRYHLYVSLACPWSHRVVILRVLRGLESVIGMSVTSPIWDETGWWFGEDRGVVPDNVNHFRHILDLYRKADPSFSEEETVPVLWDKKTSTIVSNESRDIMKMFDVELSNLGRREVCLYPPELAIQIDQAIDEIYPSIANGVYKTGFARTQRAYEKSFRLLFSALDRWEAVLSKQEYVCGDRITEADIALFVTLIRFDAVYYSHFKCNLRRISDYPNLSRWLSKIYHTPGVAETCDFDHIKKHYYGSHKELNPLGIIPLGPELKLD